MNRIAAIVITIGAGASALGGDPVGNDATRIAKEAIEVTSEAADEKDSKLKFATAGVYAVLLQDKAIDAETQKSFQESLRLEQSLISMPKSESKAKSKEDLKAQIKASLEKHDPLAALDGVGRLVTFHTIADLDPLNAAQLGDAVRDVAAFCPKCFGKKTVPCTDPNCKAGWVFVPKQCNRCKNGVIPCTVCNGGLWVPCDNCGGTAEVPQTTDKQQGRLIVPVTKKVRCPKCGPWFKQRPGFVQCHNCRDGTQQCLNCEGKGTIPTREKCPTCKNKGKLTCPKCNGTGKRNP